MVLLVIVLLNVAVLCVVKLSPVVFILSVAIHVKVEGTLLVNGMLAVPPLQMVAAFVLVITGVGFTVIVTVCAIPGHPPEVGVTV